MQSKSTVSASWNSRLAKIDSHMLAIYVYPRISVVMFIICYVDLLSGSVKYILGRDGGGIGAFDVHPEGTHLAVAERSSSNASPHVFIYMLPSLELTHVLCDGTERAYSDVSFSGNGEKLVTVGSFPDFLLSVWDWREQRGVLRTKAFGQEVRLFRAISHVYCMG